MKPLMKKIFHWKKRLSLSAMKNKFVMWQKKSIRLYYIKLWNKEHQCKGKDTIFEI